MGQVGLFSIVKWACFGLTKTILPISGFDKGYLKINDVWRFWDTRYDTDIARDSPYQCDMITEYNRFNIHSPIVFLPLTMKNW
jgi:hypothetical protein